MNNIKFIFIGGVALILIVFGASYYLNVKNSAYNPPAQSEAVSEVVPSEPSVVSSTSPVAKKVCIVTISGARYDVEPLRGPHPGGDIFKCGTDMTKTFFSQHGQKLLDGDLQKFRLAE